MIPHMCWHPMQIVWWIHVDNHLFNLQEQWNKWFCFLGGMAISFCMAWRSGQHSFKSTKTSKVTWKNDANKTLDQYSTNTENMGFNIPCIHIWPSVGAGGVIIWNPIKSPWKYPIKWLIYHDISPRYHRRLNPGWWFQPTPEKWWSIWRGNRYLPAGRVFFFVFCFARGSMFRKHPVF